MASAEDIRKFIDEAANQAAERTGQNILEQVKEVAIKAASEVAERVCGTLREEINEIKRKQGSMGSGASSSTGGSVFGGSNFSSVAGIAQHPVWTPYEHGSFEVKGYVVDWKMLTLQHWFGPRSRSTNKEFMHVYNRKIEN